MLRTIRSNLRMDTENESVFSGTRGRTETSNNPMTALGRAESFSRKGYSTIEPHPEATGVKTLLGSVSSKIASVKRARASKEETTKGVEAESSISAGYCSSEHLFLQNALQIV